MKRLLNTLFVLTEDTYLSLEGDNVVISQEKEALGRYPLHILEGIYYFGYKGISPALMGACADQGIELSLFSGKGKFRARVTGETRGNILLRKEQYKIQADEGQSLLLAKNFIFGKIYNSRWVLERSIRDHSLRINVSSVQEASKSLVNSLSAIGDCCSLDSLRGIEGEAAQSYFSVFDELVLQNKSEFVFKGRSRRPPLDRVNALLSFAYTILAGNCASALEGVGLDPYAGFLHCDRPGRTSLALDLMEELRSVFADRMILTCINNRIIQAKHFEDQANGAVLLNEDGRRAFFATWQSKKKETIVHPFLKEKIPWGLVPHAQALLLARALRGDIDGYPPFLWK